MIAQAADRRQRLSSLLVPAAMVGLAVTAYVLQPPYRGTQVLIGVAAALLVLVPHSAVWALGSVMLVEFSISNYTVPGTGTSARFVFVLAALVAVGGVLLGHLRRTDPGLRHALVAAAALVTLATLVNYLNEDATYTLKYLRFQAVQVGALVLAATCIRSERELRLAALIVLAIGVASAGAAVWQHFDRASAVYGAGTSATVGEFRGRSIGLSISPVQVSKHFTFVLAFLAGALIAGRWRLDRTRLVLLGAAALLGAGLYFAYTRSALLGVAAGLVVVAVLVGGARRLVIFGAVLVTVLLFGIGLFGSRYYLDSENDRSAAGHQALWSVGLAIALDHGLTGIGHQRFEDLSTEYLHLLEEAAAQSGEEEIGVQVIGQQRPHNDFLSVWISWGLGALLAYLALFGIALANCVAAVRSRRRLIRAMAMGCAAAIVAYALDSAFHNSLDSSALLWVLVGLSISLARLARLSEFARSARLPQPYALSAPALRLAARAHPKTIWRAA